MKRLILCIIITMSFITGCTHRAAPVTETRTLPTTGVYQVDLLISFTSIGTGINHTAYDKLISYLDDFNTKSDVKIAYEIRPAGREGEKDVCIQVKDHPRSYQIQEYIFGMLRDESRIITRHQNCK